jgi:hypothetical protein
MAMAVSRDEIPSEAHAFYRRVLAGLDEADVPFLVGGAAALAHYTGVKRYTKDFDLFIRRRDLRRTLAALDWSDCQAEVTASHWLAKVSCGEYFVDFIFATGNGVSAVDDGWFERASEGSVFDTAVKLCSAEDVLWTKAFIQERERFDGADVAHLILLADLDWHTLLEHFDPHWHVLFAHLVLFNFIYPSERHRIPAWVMEHLAEKLARERGEKASGERICQGTLLSRSQYRTDLESLGFRDARLEAGIAMSRRDIQAWTEAADADLESPEGD